MGSRSRWKKIVLRMVAVLSGFVARAPFLGLLDLSKNQRRQRWVDRFHFRMRPMIAEGREKRKKMGHDDALMLSLENMF